MRGGRETFSLDRIDAQALRVERLALRFQEFGAPPLALRKG